MYLTVNKPVFLANARFDYIPEVNIIGQAVTQVPTTIMYINIYSMLII